MNLRFVSIAVLCAAAAAAATGCGDIHLKDGAYLCEPGVKGCPPGFECRPAPDGGHRCYRDGTGNQNDAGPPDAGLCGNGILDPGESCDSTELNGRV
jgi:hypothetical protein